MKQKLTALLIVVILSGCSLYATETAESVLTMIKETSQKVTNFQAVMTQTTVTPFTPLPSVETGRVYLKGAMTRREIQKPARKIVIQTPDGIAEKDVSTGKVTQSTKADAVSLGADFKVTDITPEEALRRFDFQLSSDTPMEWQLSGLYKNMALTLTVSKAQHMITLMILRDTQSGMMVTVKNTVTVIDSIPVITKSESQIELKLGNTPAKITSTTEYRGVKLNQTLPDALFDIQGLGGAL